MPSVFRTACVVLSAFALLSYAHAEGLEPFQSDWTAYGLGNVPDDYLANLTVSFTVPANAGSSFATYSLLFGVKDAAGTFFGSRLFYDGTQVAWTVNSETFGAYLNESYPKIPIKPGDKLRAEYSWAGFYTFSVKLTNVNSGASNVAEAVTAFGFTQLYFAFDNPWINCSNYPSEGVEIFSGFSATCFDGVSYPDCTNGITWTTGVINPRCNLAAHVDQYPKQVSLTWSTKESPVLLK